MVHHAGCLSHRNALLLFLFFLFWDLVKFKTHQILFKTWIKLLPSNIQMIFMVREVTYILRGKFNFNQPAIHTALKSMSICVCGVQLWNKLNEDLQMCNNLWTFEHLNLISFAFFSPSLSLHFTQCAIFFSFTYTVCFYAVLV